MLLTDGNRKAAQQLWLRKVRIHREAPPDAGASAPKAATAKPQPAPARARAVPKLETAAQLARRERSQIRLRQKHLASKVWASVRIASRLLAWRRRVHLRLQAAELVRKRANALDVCYRCVERDASNRTTNRNAVVAANMCSERRLPILVGRLLVQQWPRARARCLRSAALPAPSTSSTVAAQPQPAPALAAPPPPNQPPPSALAAAARATLDPSEPQDFRGSKRGALARTPPSAPPPERPPPAESRKKTRGTGALQAALAAAAPAAAAPQPPTATSPLAPALLADANPFRLLA